MSPIFGAHGAAGVCHNGYAQRQSVKMRGRDNATDGLRSRCLAQVKDNRSKLMSRLRELSGDGGELSGEQGALRGVAMEVLAAEKGNNDCSECFDGSDFDLDMLILLEEALLRELEEESVRFAVCEADHHLQQQNDEDAALYEQHCREGVPCPLCGDGRLCMGAVAGELRCSHCVEMRAAVMDEEMPMEDVAEALAECEQEHWHSGCAAHASFEVVYDYGSPVLYCSCQECGFRAIAV